MSGRTVEGLRVEHLAVEDDRATVYYVVDGPEVWIRKPQVRFAVVADHQTGLNPKFAILGVRDNQIYGSLSAKHPLVREFVEAAVEGKAIVSVITYRNQIRAAAGYTELLTPSIREEVKLDANDLIALRQILHFVSQLSEGSFEPTHPVMPILETC